MAFFWVLSPGHLLQHSSLDWSFFFNVSLYVSLNLCIPSTSLFLPWLLFAERIDGLPCTVPRAGTCQAVAPWRGSRFPCTRLPGASVPWDLPAGSRDALTFCVTFFWGGAGGEGEQDDLRAAKSRRREQPHPSLPGIHKALGVRCCFVGRAPLPPFLSRATRLSRRAVRRQRHAEGWILRSVAHFPSDEWVTKELL